MNKILPLLLLLITLPAMAETTRYVTDQLEITLRSGQSTQHQILRMLPSGMAVEVLEVNAESGYTHVKTPQGIEGWVITRYLDNVPSARDRLASAEERMANLKIENSRLSKDLQQLSSEKDAAEKERLSLSKESRRQEQELTRIKQASASVLAIESENKTLKEQLHQLERDHQTLQQETEALRDRRDRDWFMVGAGVILLGIGVGLIIPKIRWRKKSGWNSL